MATSLLQTMSLKRCAKYNTLSNIASFGTGTGGGGKNTTKHKPPLASPVRVSNPAKAPRRLRNENNRPPPKAPPLRVRGIHNDLINAAYPKFSSSDPLPLLELIETHSTKLDSVNMTMILNRLASSPPSHHPTVTSHPSFLFLLDSLAALPTPSPVTISNLHIALATLKTPLPPNIPPCTITLNKKIFSAKSPDCLFDIFSIESASFDKVSYATILTKLSKIPRDHRPASLALITGHLTFQAILSSLEARISQNTLSLRPREVANMIHALAVLQIAPQHLGFRALLNHLEAKQRAFMIHGNSQEIANVAYALALSRHHSTFFNTLDLHSPQIIPNSKPQEISNIAWAFASLKHPAPLLLKTISGNPNLLTPEHAATTNQPLNRAAVATPATLSMLAWSYATLNVNCPHVFDHLTAHITTILSGSALSLCNTIWAYATVNRACPPLESHITANKTSFVAESTPQGISNVAWAFVKMARRSPPFFREVNENAERIGEQAVFARLPPSLLGYLNALFASRLCATTRTPFFASHLSARLPDRPVRKPSLRDYPNALFRKPPLCAAT